VVIVRRMSWFAHRIRHLRERVARRGKKLLGRVDNSPWVLLPSSNHAASAYADFVFGLDYLSPNSRLVRLMYEAMAARGLSCLLVNSSNVERVLAEVGAGRWRPGVYLDLCCRPGDAFEKLLGAMSNAGSKVLCDPTVRDWTVKSYSHPRLQAGGFRVPATVIIKAAEGDRELTPEERALVGERCVITPYYGVAGRGAVIGVEPTRQAIAKAREFDRKDDWLVQRMITWGRCGEREAYLRGYNVLGHRTLMWWSEGRGYSNVTWDDMRQYDLMCALELVERVGRLTGLEFFSSEIAIVGEAGSVSPEERFVLIDYVNDQCDIDPQAQPSRSPPEDWVRWVCGRLAEFTWQKKHGMREEGAGTVYLAD
jgi:hypothetical protein